MAESEWFGEVLGLRLVRRVESLHQVEREMFETSGQLQ